MILAIDIDNTLADSAWRDSLKPNWDEYHQASANDKPHSCMVELINSLEQSHWIICITTRPERWRQLTMTWLLKHKINIDELLMRPDDDFRSSPELKLEIIKSYLEDNVIAIDDREDVVTAYRGAGITALQAFPRRPK